MRKLLIISLSVLASQFSIAQESQEKELPLFSPKVSYLDSLKSTFVNHATSGIIIDDMCNSKPEKAQANPGNLLIRKANIVTGKQIGRAHV